jgi:hypothetical protein
MFEHLLRELNSLSGESVSVSIPTDADGYLDRECPNEHCLFGFKVECADWRDKVADDSAFCPMCRRQAVKGSWHTTEQVEFLRENAVAHFGRRIGEAMRADARAVNAAQRSGQFITMRVTVKDVPEPMIVPLQAAEPMRQRASCEACGCRYSYIGSAFFCPCCGHNSAVGTFQQTLAGVRLAATCGAQLRAALPVDDAEIMALQLREKGMCDVVTALQRLGERLWEALPGTAPAPRNVFQRLDDASQLWLSATGKDFSAFLAPDEMQRLRRGYQRRHLLAHAQGIVDADYVRKSGDTTAAIGQRIVVTEPILLEFVALGEKLAAGLIASCPTPAAAPVPQPAPATVADAPSPAHLRALSRYSPHAIAVARLLAETSSNGRKNDPAMSADAVRETIKLADENIAEAVYELERDGLVRRHQSLGMGAIGFYALAPSAGFFQVFDPALGIGDPVADARLVAAALIGGGEQAGGVAELAQNLGWTARRMNPALTVLISRNLVMASRALDPVWTTVWIRRQPGLRSFAEQT